MPGRNITLFLVFSLAAGFFVLSGAETDVTAKPSEPAKSHYFQDSGSQVDSLLDRIRFKITYSWSKSGEYFRLACSSVTDTLPAKKRDAESRLSIQKNELLEKSKQAVRETTSRTMEGLSQKGEEIRQNLNKIGGELKSEAAEEIRKNTDQIFK